MQGQTPNSRHYAQCKAAQCRAVRALQHHVCVLQSRALNADRYAQGRARSIQGLYGQCRAVRSMQDGTHTAGSCGQCWATRSMQFCFCPHTKLEQKINHLSKEILSLLFQQVCQIRGGQTCHKLESFLAPSSSRFESNNDQATPATEEFCTRLRRPWPPLAVPSHPQQGRTGL